MMIKDPVMKKWWKKQVMHLALKHYHQKSQKEHFMTFHILFGAIKGNMSFK